MTEPEEATTESERRAARARALRLELGDLEAYVDKAMAGEMVVVPDGLPEVIRRLRYNLTQALGPQEAGDLVPIFRELGGRLERIEAVQRWTLGFWLRAIAQRVRSIRWRDAFLGSVVG